MISPAGGDQRRELAEVLARDDVGPSTVRVGLDDLTVGETHGDHQHDDRHGQAEREAQRAAAGERQHREHRLGPVRDR